MHVKSWEIRYPARKIHGKRRKALRLDYWQGRAVLVYGNPNRVGMSKIIHLPGRTRQRPTFRK